MDSAELRQRRVGSGGKLDAAQTQSQDANSTHPAGPVKHGLMNQVLRGVLFSLIFALHCLIIITNQLLGAPLYFFNKDYYYAWMALTKQHFSLFLVNVTWWWAPTPMRISWDKSLNGQLRKTEDGRLETSFPERMVLIANHQIYTDWAYLWWIAYTSRMHGHLYIILKETLKYIPFIGQGMMFYGFIFLSRKWATDKPRFQHRLGKLKSRHSGPLSGSQSLDPMWLLIFPEGTNMSKNAKASSTKWAEKSGTKDMDHVLLPRSTGLQFCLQELKGTVDWVYDCTLAYEGIPPGEYGQDIFTLRSTYLEGRPPKSVHMHWRRFAVSSIPVDHSTAFATWVEERWREKDRLIQHFVDTGRFPTDGASMSAVPNGSGVKLMKENACIETEVKPSNPLEFVQMYLPLAALFLVINVVLKFIRMVRTTIGL